MGDIARKDGTGSGAEKARKDRHEKMDGMTKRKKGTRSRTEIEKAARGTEE